MKLIKIIVIFVTFFWPINIVYGNDNTIDRFINNTNISYSTTFSVNISLNKWDKILDKLMLMGVLWKMYGLSPYYNVLFGEKDGVYIIDPIGVEGNIYRVQSNNFNRAFEADWVIKHPQVPFSFSGKSLILLKYEGTQNNASGSL